ncbi:putative AAA family protein, partial [Rhypophila sp. PSN 637]
CVLLLDEADIFLSHREKRDDHLQRNAIVSIFLRTMEYYPCILFLTTNRPGALDEALSSWVHISLSFSILDHAQTMDLFRMNLKRSENIAKQRGEVEGELRLVINKDEILDFADDQFRNSNSDFWNGRVIRNAFQVAMSLAYVESPSASYYHQGEETAPETPRPIKHMGREHFERVLEIFTSFKNYRQSLFNKTDERLAHQRQDRLASS